VTSSGSSSKILGDAQLCWTVQEAALACRRAPKTIRNLIYLHNLPVRRDGRQPVRGKAWRRRILLLPPTTVDVLRRLTRGG